MSLGVVRYCTPQGGSGYIPNPYLPWLSTFNITHQSPVYDQDMAWMREEKPGSFTNYARFGPPYSIDGGVLPPYAGGPVIGDDGEPVPYETGCGMGDLVLLRSDVVAPMPSITSTARSGCQEVSNCPGDVASWVKSNPWFAAGIALLGGFVLFGGGRQ